MSRINASACFVTAFIFLFCIGSDVLAQRREGSKVAASITVEFTKPVLFGDVFVPARVLHLSLSKGAFVFTDPKTMIVLSSVPVVSSVSTEDLVEQPILEILRDGKKVTLSLAYKDEVHVAQGETAEGREPSGTSPDVATSKVGVDVSAELSKRPKDVELIMRATVRYREGVMHCADKAFRRRWGTDHRKFKRCLCPITRSWRLPKVKKPLRLSVELQRYRSGMSFTVNARGRVTECRVWRGRRPPEGEPPLLEKK